MAKEPPRFQRNLVAGSFTAPVAAFARSPGLGARPEESDRENNILSDHVHLPDRAAAADAAELIARFGEHAGSEAEARANLSRERGNVVHFCRWRQIGRLIELLGRGRRGSTIH